MPNDNLQRMYPMMFCPIRCENGCGAVIELASAYSSYKRNDHDGKHLFVCECCAAEEGHMDECEEKPEEAPVCRRKSKKQLR